MGHYDWILRSDRDLAHYLSSDHSLGNHLFPQEMTELDILHRVGGHIVAAGLLGILLSAILRVFKGRKNPFKNF